MTVWSLATAESRSFMLTLTFCDYQQWQTTVLGMSGGNGLRLPDHCQPVGGIPDIVRDGRNGLLVAPGDVSGLRITYRIFRTFRIDGFL